MTECDNGGTLIPKTDGTGNECFCGPFYAGKKCEYKLCLNGGTIGDQDICDCANTGYSGDYCQHGRICDGDKGLEIVGTCKQIM